MDYEKDKKRKQITEKISELRREFDKWCRFQDEIKVTSKIVLYRGGLFGWLKEKTTTVYLGYRDCGFERDGIKFQTKAPIVNLIYEDIEKRLEDIRNQVENLEKEYENMENI